MYCSVTDLVKGQVQIGHVTAVALAGYFKAIATKNIYPSGGIQRIPMFIEIKNAVNADPEGVASISVLKGKSMGFKFITENAVE